MYKNTAFWGAKTRMPAVVNSDTCCTHTHTKKINQEHEIKGFPARHLVATGQKYKVCEGGWDEINITDT